MVLICMNQININNFKCDGYDFEKLFYIKLSVILWFNIKV